MGVLRADRITGLGGANAITGSTFFSTERQSLTFDGSDINFDTGDFTVEAWIFHIGGNDDTIISDVSGWTFAYGATGVLRFYMATGSNVVDATSSFISNEWVHVAVVRSSGTLTFYQNGTAVGSHSYSHDIANNSGTTYIGKYHSQDVQNFIGHISNLRIIQGRALYTGAFTPPTSRLEKTSDTVLLTCNSASDVLNEETGKYLLNENPNYPQADQPGPTASRFTPNTPVGFSTTTDVGSQYGTTFDGFTVFATSTYMVPPGGNTRERNRGLALFGGGETPSKVNSIEFINVQSMGIAKDFGDFTSTSGDVKALGSSTRGVFRTNYSPSSRNTLEFTTFAAASNSIDFGDLVIAVGQRPGASNQTRGIFSGGLFPGSTTHNEMDLITIATAGNATDFGNLSVSRADTSALASSTRMIVGGGYTPSTNYGNVMDFVTIATTGNASDFGDLNTGKRAGTAVASSTRGIFGPGKAPSVSDVIDFVTIATTGNATDFGDALVARGGASAASNSIRGLFAGGYSPSLINGIEFITIATEGNGFDFGDMTFVSQYSGGCSDSHGGL